MNTYKVLRGKEFFTLEKVYSEGETVQLLAKEGDAFLGHVLELVASEPETTDKPSSRSAKKATE